MPAGKTAISGRRLASARRSASRSCAEVKVEIKTDRGAADGAADGAAKAARSDKDAAGGKGAAARGLVNVKGHRLTGGMRASLYNAMPMEGVRALAEYMKEFELEHV